MKILKKESDLRKWYQWCQEYGEMRELKDIPPAELDRLLSHLYDMDFARDRHN